MPDACPAAALMAGPDVVTLRADLREPEQVLGDARVRDLLDFGQPVGIMFMCVLHCLWDREDRGGSSDSSATPWCRAATWPSAT